MAIVRLILNFFILLLTKEEKGMDSVRNLDHNH